MNRSSLVFLALAVVATSFTPAKAQSAFQGLYFGLHGGYMWEDTSGRFDNTSLAPLDLDGGLIGAQLGYNVQYNWFVMGVEVDASTGVQDGGSASNIGASGLSTISSDMSYLTSARARLGVAVNNVLLFGSIGWGATRFEVSDANPGFVGEMKLRESGLVYGGGLEWKLNPRISLRGEYLHYDVGTSAYLPSNFPDVNAGDRIRFDDIDVARAAINISLNPW